MHIYFAGDHAGFEMKGKLMEFAHSLGHEVEDIGPLSYVAGDDYTDYVIPLAKKVAERSFIPPLLKEVSDSARTEDLNPPAHQNESLPLGKGELRTEEVRGIVVAGSGQGEIIAMNRISGARAALFCPCNLELIKASRDHNDSNIFAIGARFCTIEQAKEGIEVWLTTPFSNDPRHIRRLAKIEQIGSSK